MNHPAPSKHRLAGVMGWPVEHSLSPRLHGYWLNHYGIAGAYTALPVQPGKLRDALQDLHSQGYSGVNLTLPHKEDALALVDHLDPLAEKVGAVNTVIVRNDGTVEGRNTDVFGFSENLRTAGWKRDGKPAVLLGAGGAARAALVALFEMHVPEIRIVNRTRDKAESLAAEFSGQKIKPYDWGDPAALDGAGLLINATSLGLAGKPPLEISLEKLPPEAWVTDMVYAPLMTGLLKQAQTRGNRIVDGLGMLLHQARPAFAAFFGKDPEVTADQRAYVLEKK